jgi:uncharacterized protein YdhG (YjbR/CyaY superfamily)
MIKKDCKSIDEYIDQFSPPIQEKLNQIRNLIHKLAPDATESINYQISTFKLNDKILVHFAGYHSHIGFYPTPAPIQVFHKQLKIYKTSKGAIQFKLNEELPVGLIEEIILFRIMEITAS